MRRAILAGVAVLGLHSTVLAEGPLGPGERVAAGGAPIDVEVGHAAPLVVDWDGDGKPDLLVGQFGGGRLRIHRNVGAAEAPRFDGHEWFRAGDAEGTVPAG